MCPIDSLASIKESYQSIACAYRCSVPGEPQDSGELLAASVGYSAMSLRITPLVQPKPSCNGYSPPPPGRPVAMTSYFSTNFPFSPYTRLTLSIQRQAMIRASGEMEYRRRPETLIHCNGAQPLGASHC